ncbi:MAG: substrate-binding domain-containing protein [Prevotella sp.]|nr:substrate-binding domain-containing protein [Prevotella sp.]
MKRTYILTLLVAILLCSCYNDKDKLLIGVSQCSEDIWRNKLNDELRIGTFFHDDISLAFASANDNDATQIAQIDSLVALGIDLLIVSPNQMATITPAIDRAYDKGIPVIVFDRKTNSKKFTAYIGADNQLMGREIGEYIATQLKGTGTVIEIKGLEGSSPSIDRSKGFAEAMSRAPGIEVAARLQGDWTEESGYKAVKAYLKAHPETVTKPIDYVFGQNDRMAMGARRAFEEMKKTNPAMKLPQYCGIDGLPGPNGGIAQVENGLLEVSYIYPTHGDKVMELALQILEKKPYKNETLLQSALVTRDNAHVLMMQGEEAQRQGEYLNNLHNKTIETLKMLDTQTTFLITIVIIAVLLIAAFVYAYYAYLTKARLSDELRRLYESERQMKQQMEALKDAQMDLYTNVAHQLRTPLSLIAGPLSKLRDSDELRTASEDTATLLDVMTRNTDLLTSLVGKVLDAEAKKDSSEILKMMDTGTITPPDTASDIEQSLQLEQFQATDTTPQILIVDDNADIRIFLRSILSAKYVIYEAEDGKKGLDIANEIVPDLIISDVMMPVMNGLQFCQHVKRNLVTSHIPVILLTARAMSAQQIEGYQHGADAYITKPFDHNMLIARVENLLLNRERLKKSWQAPIASSIAPVDEKEDDHAVELKVDIDNVDEIGKNADEVATPREDAFLDRLYAVIDSHMHNSDISVEDIGLEIGLSRVQLYRKVKALTGLSPVELMRKIRLNKAREMLLTTEKNISEVAYEVGFSAPSYFTKCFKEEFGQLPNELLR